MSRNVWTKALAILATLVFAACGSSSDDETGDVSTDIQADTALDSTMDVVDDKQTDDNIVPDTMEDKMVPDTIDDQIGDTPAPDTGEDIIEPDVTGTIAFGGRCGFDENCNLGKWIEECTVDEELDGACWQEAQNECANSSCQTGLCWNFVVGNYLNFNHNFCTKECETDADCEGADGPWGTQWSCVELVGGLFVTATAVCMPTTEVTEGENGLSNFVKCDHDEDCTETDHSCQIQTTDAGLAAGTVCQHKNMGETVEVGEKCVFDDENIVYEKDCVNGFGSCLGPFEEVCTQHCKCGDFEDQATCDDRECAGLTDWTCGTVERIYGKNWDMCHPRTDCLEPDVECSEGNFCQASFNQTFDNPQFIYWCSPKSEEADTVAFGGTCDEGEETPDDEKVYCENTGWCLTSNVCTKPCGSTADCDGLADTAICATDEISIDDGWWDGEPQWPAVTLQYCVPLDGNTPCFDQNMDLQCVDGQTCTYILTPETMEDAPASHSVELLCADEPDEATGEYGDACGEELGVTCKSGLCVGSEEEGYYCTNVCADMDDCQDFQIDMDGSTYDAQAYCGMIRTGQLMDNDPANDAFAPVCLVWNMVENGTPAEDSLAPCTADSGSLNCVDHNGQAQVCTNVVLTTDANHPAWSYQVCVAQDASELLDPVLGNGEACAYSATCESGVCINGEYAETDVYLTKPTVTGTACTEPTELDGTTDECTEGEVCAAQISPDGSLGDNVCVLEEEAYVGTPAVMLGICVPLCVPGDDGDAHCQSLAGLDDENAFCGEYVTLERSGGVYNGVVHLCQLPE